MSLEAYRNRMKSNQALLGEVANSLKNLGYNVYVPNNLDSTTCYIAFAKGGRLTSLSFKEVPYRWSLGEHRLNCDLRPTKEELLGNALGKLVSNGFTDNEEKFIRHNTWLKQL